MYVHFSNQDYWYKAKLMIENNTGHTIPLTILEDISYINSIILMVIVKTHSDSLFIVSGQFV